MFNSYSDTLVARTPATETQCQQGKCHNKARFIKRFTTKGQYIKAFRFCAKHLDTRIKGYDALDFNLISQ